MTHVPPVPSSGSPAGPAPGTSGQGTATAPPAWQGQRALLPVHLSDAEIAALIPAGRDTAGWGVHRLMGLETEFGVHAPAQPGAAHTALSTEVVNAYAALVTSQGGSVAGTEWDYGEESPLVDARGWRMPRSQAHPSQLTDELGAGGVNEHGEAVHQLMNVVLPNGARLYVDHAHPEYSAPETTNPWDAMVWDQAGDRVAQAASEHIASSPGAPQVLLYKNNTDSKSVSYGAHENYLVARALDFQELAEHLLPFFVARQVVCGAGRVGLGATGSRPGFQISQRADFFEEQIGLETTIHRPIVNTRDEPHSTPDRYRRLHVIIGDANLSQYATWLRCGMTALVLSMIELGTCPHPVLQDPVRALQQISHDPTLTATVLLADGRRVTGLDLLRLYLDAAVEHVERFGMHDDATDEVLRAWGECLEGLATDPGTLADRLDWVAKHQLLSAYRQRHGLEWDDPRLHMMDLQYADLRPEKSLYRALVRRGSMRVLAPEPVLQRAMQLPPPDTRAWVRGRTVALHGDRVVGASWDTLLLRPEPGGRVFRCHLREPLEGTAAQTAGVLDADARRGEAHAPASAAVGKEGRTADLAPLLAILQDLDRGRPLQARVRPPA